MAAERVVLITGCSTGIGRALVGAFDQRNQWVYATARRPESIADLESDRVSCLPLDVTIGASIQSAVETVLDNAGRIDILINNAGFGQMGPTVDLELDRLRQQFETNVVGQIAMIQAVAPHMMAQRSGCIVNIGSISGILTTPFAGAYCASKAALHSLSEALRIELAPFGVNVVIVQPGGVRSRFGENASHQVDIAPDSVYAALAEGIQARAVASQQHAADVVDVADRIAEAALDDRPPYVLRVGKGGRLYPFLKRVLPHRVADRILKKRFGIAEFSPPE